MKIRQIVLIVIGVIILLLSTKIGYYGSHYFLTNIDGATELEMHYFMESISSSFKLIGVIIAISPFYLNKTFKG